MFPVPTPPWLPRVTFYLSVGPDVLVSSSWYLSNKADSVLLAAVCTIIFYFFLFWLDNIHTLTLAFISHFITSVQLETIWSSCKILKRVPVYLLLLTSWSMKVKSLSQSQNHRVIQWKTLQEMICGVCVLRLSFSLLTESPSCCLAMNMHNTDTFTCEEEPLAEMVCINSSRLEKTLKSAKSKTSES